MVKKEFKFEDVKIEDVRSTEDENINHINNLIVTSEDLNKEPEETAADMQDADTEEKKTSSTNTATNTNSKTVNNDTKDSVEKQKTRDTKKSMKENAKTVVKENTAAKEKDKAPTVPIKKKIFVAHVPKNSHNNHKKEAENKNIESKKTSTTKRFVERTKMKEHKNARHEKPHKKNSMMWIWIALAIIVVVAVAILLIMAGYTKPVNQVTNEVAATVNGEPIYMKDIDAQYQSINPLMQSVYTKETLLNQTIDELLLVQEAKLQNIVATPADVATELNNFKQQNGLTDADLEGILAKQNLTMTQLEGLIKNKLIVQQLLNQTIFNGINITPEEVANYYAENKSLYSTPEQVTAAHILIFVNDTVTDAQGYSKILEINKSVNSTNFCGLVKQYTQDLGSKDTCGTYTFGRGEMVPEFENASFNLAINKTAIVKSIYGYHLIKKLAYMPARTPTLSEVTVNITQTLKDMRAQVNFDNFLKTLRDKAVIVNYLVKEENTTSITNTSAPTINAVDNTSAPTTTTTPIANLDSFAKCLTKNGAKFYGASWCPHCQNQKTMFGDSMQFVTYVECAEPDNPQVQTAECSAAGITGYPTWLINDTQYPGEQTLESLAKLSGCTLPQ